MLGKQPSALRRWYGGTVLVQSPVLHSCPSHNGVICSVPSLGPVVDNHWSGSPALTTRTSLTWWIGHTKKLYWGYKILGACDGVGMGYHYCPYIRAVSFSLATSCLADFHSFWAGREIIMLQESRLTRKPKNSSCCEVEQCSCPCIMNLRTDRRFN